MCHVLRREDGEPVTEVWHLEVDGISRKGRPKISWKDHN